MESIHGKFRKIKAVINLRLIGENDKIFKKITIVYEGLQYDSKQKSAPLVNSFYFDEVRA